MEICHDANSMTNTKLNLIFIECESNLNLDSFKHDFLFQARLFTRYSYNNVVYLTRRI